MCAPGDTYIYRSKNGWHIITPPFDLQWVVQDVKQVLHRNPIMLWAY